ncbi:MAG: hypothetical protein PHO09_08605 [Sphaerochaeta sp.]|nr:hypothetical protein [Sphaerochaeta sp.]
MEEQKKDDQNSRPNESSHKEKHPSIFYRLIDLLTSQRRNACLISSHQDNAFLEDEKPEP